MLSGHGGAAGCFNRPLPVLAAGVQVADVQPQSLDRSRVFQGSKSPVPGSSSAHTGFHAHLRPIPRRGTVISCPPAGWMSAVSHGIGSVGSRCWKLACRDAQAVEIAGVASGGGCADSADKSKPVVVCAFVFPRRLRRTAGVLRQAQDEGRDGGTQRGDRLRGSLCGIPICPLRVHLPRKRGRTGCATSCRTCGRRRRRGRGRYSRWH
jgi:hypothetical protein